MNIKAKSYFKNLRNANTLKHELAKARKDLIEINASIVKSQRRINLIRNAKISQEEVAELRKSMRTMRSYKKRTERNELYIIELLDMRYGCKADCTDYNKKLKTCDCSHCLYKEEDFVEWRKLWRSYQRYLGQNRDSYRRHSNEDS